VAYIGIEKEGIDLEELKGFLRKQGFRVGECDEVELKTKLGWKKFVRVEVLGFVEGIAPLLVRKYGKIAFEWGEHTILGEVSAKLWYEAARVCYPNGETETITTMICDSFLDAKIPSENIRGTKGSVVIGGLRLSIPITIKELEKVARVGKEHLKKLERLIEVYGLNKILSEEALILLKKVSKEASKRAAEEKVEIDYEAGFVIKMHGGKILTIPLQQYLASLIVEGRVEQARTIVENAPKELARSLIEDLKNEAQYLKALNKEDEAKKILSFIEQQSSSTSKE